MSAHTPGPWIWADDYRGLYGAGPDNAVLDFAYCENMWLAGDRIEANARLLAAAPELLAVLGEIVASYLESGGEVGGADIDAARAAIFTATGVKI